MLTLLRQSVGTWVAKVFILLLVASFGVWGVSGAIIGGSANSIITVGKTNVSVNDYLLAYEQARMNLSRQFGQQLTREQMRAFGVDTNIMGQLLSSAVLDESARNMGLGLSEKNLAGLIGEDKAFQDANGNFDRQVLVQQLRRLGMSEADYVENRQAVAIRDQLLEGISANTSTPEAFVDAYNKYRNERRVFEYVTLSADLLETKPSPTPQDIKTHYGSDKVKYMAPEYRKIIVVKMEAEDISDPDSISSQEIEEYYDSNREAEYTTPEKRSIQQLTLNDESQGQSILERLAAGEIFEAILNELGKTAKDIDIGQYTKSGLPDISVGNAAFGLALNQVSDVVNGVFGPVLLRVTQIIPAIVNPLAEVEPDIRSRLSITKAADELFDIHDKLEDERAAGDTLSEAAAKVHLKLRTIEKIDASGRDPAGELVQDLPQSQKLLSEAFKTAEGVETDPISINSSGFVWYEVKEIYPDRQKPLEEVTEEVSNNWVENQIAIAVEKVAKDLKSKLDSGEDFATALADILPEHLTSAENPPRVEESAELSREDTSDELSAAAIGAGFATAIDKTAIAVGSNNGDQVVLKVARIVEDSGKSVGPDELKQLNSAIGADLLAQLIGDLQQKESVTINQNAIIAAQNLIR
jgi:peptidyl-prolyl cis-trans isomerase D